MKRLDVIGFGPGSIEGMTMEARQAIGECDAVVGFATYIKLLQQYFMDKEYYSNGMGGEVERTRQALELAAGGRHVALVCSGDSQVYGLAGLAYELGIEYPDVEIRTIAGVTAALSGSAILGAAAGNDLCTISLSDYHTSWEAIEDRLASCADCDFVIALYNPRSKARPDTLRRACDVLLQHVEPDRPCGVAKNIGRTGQQALVMTLEELRDYEADMFSTVFIGNSKTRIIGVHLVTPRGYLD